MRKSSLALGALLFISIVVIVSAGLGITGDIVNVRADPGCIDDDGDGYGVCPDCGTANGCTYDGDDCDDTDGDIHPGATEICNGLNDDCDGATDEDFRYLDPQWGWLDIGDPCNGIGECGSGDVECIDINTASCDTNPGGSRDQSVSESCDGKDNDCDTEIDESGVCFLSITLSNGPVTFPNMNPGTTINANTGYGFPLTLTIDSGTTVSDISVTTKADNSYFAGPGTLAVSNMKWSDEATGTYTDYTNLDAIVCTGLVADDTCDIYHQLYVPSGQVPGDYSVGIIITATSPMG